MLVESRTKLAYTPMLANGINNNPDAGGEILANPPAKVDTSTPSRPFAPSRRLRGSCDFCTRRKRKCDGDPSLGQTRYGADRCSLCIARRQPECHYSVRLLTGPRGDSAGKRASKLARTNGSAGGEVYANAAALTDGNARNCAGTATGGWGADGGVMTVSPILPLKRARLSPSPATGLIGLRENAYIGDFFHTMGFLPFTSESFIRKAMVSTMFRTMQESDPGFPGHEGNECYEDGGWGENAWMPRGRAREEDAIESSAAACVLWSTVGVGCLVRGRPKSSMERYMHLAREALSSCFDDGTVETARAFTAMAILQNFSGNEEKSNKYIDFAKSIMSSLPQEEVPVDLVDTHLFLETCEMVEGNSRRVNFPDLEKALGSVDVGLAKEPRLIQQKELCRWLLKTDIRMALCFSQDMSDHGLSAGGNVCSMHTPWESCGSGKGFCEVGVEGDVVAPDVVYDEGQSGSSGPEDGREDITPGLDAVAEPRPAAAALTGFVDSFNHADEPPPPGEMSRKFAAEVLPAFELMLQATNTPEVRDGVGELYFRSIMAYASLLQSDNTGASHGLSRCAEIFLENPGLCRFTGWKHVVHCTLACLTISRNRGKYELLRNAYNSVIDDPEVPRAPPAEEWVGMSCICEGLFCRSLYTYFMTFVSVKCGGNAHVSHEDTSSVTTTTIAAMSACSSADESWARGGFLIQGQPAHKGEAPRCTPNPEVAPRFGRAFGGGFDTAQQTATATGFGAGSASKMRAGSALLITAISSSSSTSSSVGPVENGTGGAAVAAAAVSTGDVTARAEATNYVNDEQKRDGLDTLPLLQPIQQGGADAAAGEGDAGLELLGPSELEGEDAASLMDAVDALLGDAVLDGFGEEGSNGDDMLAFF